MAVAFVAQIGTAQDKVASMSQVITTTAAAAAGSLVVLAIALDPTSVGLTITISDSAGGNTWTLAGNVTNGSGTAGVRSHIFASKLTNGIANGGTITFSFNTNVTAKASVALNYSGADNAEDVAAGTGTGNSTTPTASLTPTLPDDLLVGVVGREGPTGDAAGTNDADTAGGASWVQRTSIGTSGGAAASNIGAGYVNPAATATVVSDKITTSAAAQTYNPTLGTSRLWAEVLVTFKATVTFDPATVADVFGLDEE